MLAAQYESTVGHSSIMILLIRFSNHSASQSMSITHSWLATLILALAPAVGLGQEKSILDATLRQLEKDITAVRGLAFKSPVVAKVIVRPKTGAKGVQGYYSIKEKTLYLYDDIKGNYERGVL